jgi:5-methylcytosine-specific restriction endonuclease McrA
VITAAAQYNAARREKYAQDPEPINARARERYATDATYRDQAKARRKEWYSKNRNKALAYQKARTAENRRRVNALKTQCAECGGTDNLEFHHRNPAEKSFDVSMRMNLSLARIMAEVRKCVVLCFACHVRQGHHGGHHGGRRVA